MALAYSICVKIDMYTTKLTRVPVTFLRQIGYSKQHEEGHVTIAPNLWGVSMDKEWPTIPVALYYPPSLIVRWHSPHTNAFRGKKPGDSGSRVFVFPINTSSEILIFT